MVSSNEPRRETPVLLDIAGAVVSILLWERFLHTEDYGIAYQALIYLGEVLGGFLSVGILWRVLKRKSSQEDDARTMGLTWFAWSRIIGLSAWYLSPLLAYIGVPLRVAVAVGGALLVLFTLLSRGSRSLGLPYSQPAE